MVQEKIVKNNPSGSSLATGIEHINAAGLIPVDIPNSIYNWTKLGLRREGRCLAFTTETFCIVIILVSKYEHFAKFISIAGSESGKIR